MHKHLVLIFLCFEILCYNAGVVRNKNEQLEENFEDKVIQAPELSLKNDDKQELVDLLEQGLSIPPIIAEISEAKGENPPVESESDLENVDQAESLELTSTRDIKEDPSNDRYVREIESYVVPPLEENFDFKRRPDPPPLIYPPAHPIVLPPGVKTTSDRPNQLPIHEGDTNGKFKRTKKVRLTTPKVVENTWNMTSANGTKCIMFDGQFTFNIPYVTTDRMYRQANMTIPKDAKLTNNSKCVTEGGGQLVELEFEGNVASFEFVKKKDNSTAMKKLSMDYIIDPVRFPNAAYVGMRKHIVADNIDAFSTPPGQSFDCPKPTKIEMSGGVSMLASNVQLDAFRELASTIFQKPTDCNPAGSSASSLPVTVGSLVASSVPAGTCLAKFFKDKKSKSSEKK